MIECKHNLNIILTLILFVVVVVRHSEPVRPQSPVHLSYWF